MTFAPDQLLRLRAIDIRPTTHPQHGAAFVLRDPLELSDHMVVLPRELAPLLGLLDGGLNYAEAHAIVASQIGTQTGPVLLDQLLLALEQALLLDTPAFQVAHTAALMLYRTAPFRTAALADLSYAADPGELRTWFDQLIDQAEPVQAPATLQAILSPHIDYQRGAATYAQTWAAARAALQHVECVLLLATDHYSPEPFTLTTQQYATPFGVLPTDPGIVANLADAIGPRAFEAELYHTVEHSVELVTTWLQHGLCGRTIPMIPLLCGSFAAFITGQADPAQDAQITAISQVIHSVCADRSTLLVISGDLSHVGPAFGGKALTPTDEAQLHQHDARVLENLASGDPARFFSHMHSTRNHNNVCGLPPAYLAMRSMPLTHGISIGYQRCPADDANHSAVTIAGMLW